MRKICPNIYKTIVTRIVAISHGNISRIKKNSSIKLKSCEELKNFQSHLRFFKCHVRTVNRNSLRELQLCIFEKKNKCNFEY